MEDNSDSCLRELEELLLFRHPQLEVRRRKGKAAEGEDEDGGESYFLHLFQRTPSPGIGPSGCIPAFHIVVRYRRGVKKALEYS